MQKTSAPIVEKLDPYNVANKLFRDATTYKDGKIVKDLTKLNRPIHRIVMVEHRPDAYSMQPENTIRIKPWHGDVKDQTLISLMPILIQMARQSNFQTDMRAFITQSFNNMSGEEIIEFYRQQYEAKKQQEQAQKQQQSGGWFSFSKK